MIFLKLIHTNLARHRVRTLISVAGIAFSVAAMLTVVTILQGAVGMFAGLLSKDSQVIGCEAGRRSPPRGATSSPISRSRKTA